MNIQKTAEKILYGWAFLIIVCHLLLASFQYVIPYREYRPYILWPSLIFFIAVGIYTLATLISSSSRTRTLTTLKKYFSFEQVLLLIIFLWLLLSIYLNGKREDLLSVYFRAHDWRLFDTFICMFVLFPLPRLLGKDRSKQLIEVLMHIVVIFYSVFTIYCLWHVFHLEVLTFPSGEQAGMTAETQLMLGFHPNTTGMIAATMFCLCVYMVVTQEWLVKILYTVFGFANLLVVYLSNSRTPFLAVVIFLAFIAFWLTWLALKDKNIFLKILLSLAVAAGIFIFFWKARTWTFLAFENITHFQEELASGLTFTEEKHTPALLASHHYFQTAEVIPLASYGEGHTRQLDGISGRDAVWNACIRVMTESNFNLFFGVAPAAVSDSISTVGRFSKEIAHAHNAILQVGISSGLPALAVFIVLLTDLACHCIHALFNYKAINREIIALSGGILCFVIINMAEAYLFCYFSIICCFFYLLCGEFNSQNVQKISFSRTESLVTKGLSFTVSVVCVIAVLVYANLYIIIDSDKIQGSGTRTDPYLIENKDDLCYFRDLVNHGNTFYSKYILQTDDIDLENISWTPIGLWNNSYYFEGTYDGGCHVIENLYFPAELNMYRPALFGWFAGTIKNLGIESGSISGIKPAAIVNISVEEKDAAIINCYNKATVTGTDRAAGICEVFYDDVIINCLNEGSISAPISAGIVSGYGDTKVYCAEEKKSNVSTMFGGSYVSLSVTGETIHEKLNSGLDELISQGVLKEDDVTRW